MTTTEVINDMRFRGLDKAADELLRRSQGKDISSITITDYDDKAYECGLAQYLQDNAKWVNHQTKNAFVVYFSKDEGAKTQDLIKMTRDEAKDYLNRCRTSRTSRYIGKLMR